MKKRWKILPALCCAALLFTGCAPQLTQPEPDQPPSAQPTSAASPKPTPELFPDPTLEPTPELSLDTDNLDMLAQSAEEGAVLPDSLLLAPVERSEILEGNLIGYARLRVDGWVFEWIQSDIWVRDDMGGWEEQLLISRETADGLAFRDSFDMRNGGQSFVDEEKFVWADVDFDGKPDLLLRLGHFGAQMACAYACLLQREEGFEECSSFAGIFNPAIDEENQLILSSWRGNAATHGWGMYAYQAGEFVLTRVLIEEPAPDGIQGNEIVWQWTEGGTVIGRSDELTEEEIDDLIYNENSEWGLRTDRWNTLADGVPMYYNG